MRTLILQNVTREGPGLVEKVLREKAMPFDVVNLDGGGKIPPAKDYGFLVILGGPDSANDASEKIRGELAFIRTWLESGRPYLGICLGMQLLVKAAGGEVVRAAQKETGFFDPSGAKYEIVLTEEGRRDPLFEGLADVLPVFQLHGETVLPAAGTALLAEGRGCRYQAVRHGVNAYGLQCHLEVTAELLTVWADQDGDLAGMNKQEMLDVYRSLEPVYTANGRKMIDNFFSLPHLTAGGKR